MLVYDIALTLVHSIGDKRAKELIDIFGSAEAVFKTDAEDIALMTQLPKSSIDELLHNRVFVAAEKELKFMEENGIRALAYTSVDYPQRLRECTDPPIVLYVKGDIDFNSGEWLSIVGTRKETPYGKKATNDLVAEVARLSPNTVIVSGLAKGIDIAAHTAAMEHGLRTVAVLGNPLNWIYPARHATQAQAIIEGGGALVSDFSSVATMLPSNFLRRNRISAGLSSGTLVVESPEKGGSLSTARCAFEYSRDVMAVPGRIGDEMSQGTNNLISSTRAHLVTNGRDILNALNWEYDDKPHIVDDHDDYISLTIAEQDIMKILRERGIQSIDEVARTIGLPVYEISSTISLLELKGYVRVNRGNFVERI